MKRYFLLILFLTGTWNVPAQPSSPTREYQIKAAFLFNFSQFVEWPPSAFPAENTPITIGVLGDNPFGNYLKQTVRNEIVHGRHISVVQFKTVDEVTDCHILFITIKRSDIVTEALDKLKSRNILTVGESAYFIRYGGMVRFVTEESKIRLQINPEPAKEAELTISSKLLRLAEIVMYKE